MMRNVTTFLASLLVAVGTFASAASTTVRNGVTLLGVDREVISKSLSPTGLEPAAISHERNHVRSLADALADLYK